MIFVLKKNMTKYICFLFCFLLCLKNVLAQCESYDNTPFCCSDFYRVPYTTALTATATGKHAGTAIALEGHIAVVGYIGRTSVTVYEDLAMGQGGIPMDWQEVATLNAPDTVGTFENFGGAVAISLSGPSGEPLIAVATISGNSHASSKLFIYEKYSVSWWTLVAHDSFVDTHFSTLVFGTDIGYYIIAGEGSCGESSCSHKKVHVLKINGPTAYTGVTVEVAATVSYGELSHGYGAALASDDSTKFIVGAPYYQASSSDPLVGMGQGTVGPGAAFIHTMLWDAWGTLTFDVQLLEHEHFDSWDGEWKHFGRAVAIFGDVAAVGAELDSELGTRAGAVYVYIKSESTELYDFHSKIFAHDASANSLFGHSLGINSRVLVVAASEKSVPGAEKTGGLYVFDTTTFDQVTFVDNRYHRFNAQFGDVLAMSRESDYNVMTGSPDADDDPFTDNSYITDSGRVNIVRYLCDTYEDQCTSSPCLHNGICEDRGPDAYFCDCTGTGYAGYMCEEQIDDCLSAPCVMGLCLDETNGFSCLCISGTGELCDTDVDDCVSSPCGAGFKCNDYGWGIPKNVNPECTDFYCCTDIDDCASSPCGSGEECTDTGANSFDCVDIDDCASNPCRNGGTCTDTGANSFGCDCTGTGFTGAFCTFQPSEFCPVGEATLDATHSTSPSTPEIGNFGSNFVYKDRLLVFASIWDNNNQGSVYIWHHSTYADFAVVATLTADDAVDEDKFGWSADISADHRVILVGAHSVNLGDGAAYVFTGDGITHSWTQQLKIPGELNQIGQFGDSVIISNDLTLVISASMVDLEAGKVYIYDVLDAEALTWESTPRTLVSSDILPADLFGYNMVYLSSADYFLISAPGTDTNIGSVYVFDGTLSVEIFILESDEHTQASDPTVVPFGHRTAGSANGRIFITQAEYNNAGEGGVGVLYIFDRNADGVTWTQTAALVPEDIVDGDRFGVNPVWNEDQQLLFVGNALINTYTGDIRVYLEESPGTWAEILKITSSMPAIATLFGGGIVITPTNLIVASQFSNDLYFSRYDCFKECFSNPCANDGICFEPANGGFNCTCPDGFTGYSCETNIDDCISSPCADGMECVDGVVAFSCVDIDDCTSSPCLNDGTCSDDGDPLNFYQCTCPAGFKGPECQLDYSACLSSPCLNGANCSFTVDGDQICSCPLGYTGSVCQESVDDCLSSPCLNNGFCADDGLNMFQCFCEGTGYEGSICDIEKDECDTKPCKNGAACVDLLNEFQCDCSDTGFTGFFCEEQINDCLSSPCFNNANCTDDRSSYMCDCASGFTGSRCETADVVVEPPIVDNTIVNVTCTNSTACMTLTVVFTTLANNTLDGLVDELPAIVLAAAGGNEGDATVSALFVPLSYPVEDNLIEQDGQLYLEVDDALIPVIVQADSEGYSITILYANPNDVDPAVVSRDVEEEIVASTGIDEVTVAHSLQQAPETEDDKEDEEEDGMSPTVVGIIIALCILAVAGVIAFYVYTRRKNKAAAGKVHIHYGDTMQVPA